MTAPPLAVELHAGVRLSGGGAVDRATRRNVALSDDDLDAVLLVERLAHVSRSRGALGAVLYSCVAGRTLRPLRWIELSFRRRHPTRGLVAVTAAVAGAALLPAAAMTVVFVAPALVAGLLVGAVPDIVGTALAGAAVGTVSLIAHECAHLLALRALERDHSVGAVSHSFANVWIVGPPLAARQARWVALAGPIMGAVACGLAGLLGTPSWLCVGIGIVHLANLLPCAPDGRVVWARGHRGGGPSAS